MKIIFCFLCCLACLRSYASEETLSFSKEKEYAVNYKRFDLFTAIDTAMKKESENRQGKFYALIYDCLTTTPTKNADLHLFFADNRPKVVPNSFCAVYDPELGMTNMEWMLPSEDYFDLFLDAQDFMPYRIIESIKRFKDGSLK